MNYGFYAAYLGMRARQRSLDVIANNIANASTEGFKADRLFYRSVEASEIERLRAQGDLSLTSPGTGAATLEQAGRNPATSQSRRPANTEKGGDPATAQPPTAGGAASSAAAPAWQDPIDRAFGVVTAGVKDFSTGSVRDTGRPLDVALQGDGWLVVQTPRGERYTRAGSLTIDASGQLVTPHGDLVVGDGGPITLRGGASDVLIGDDGTVSVKGQSAGRLKIVRFKDPQTALVKEGETLFAAAGSERPAEAVGTRVTQGALEQSNVNVVSQMASMMQNSREFDSLERSIKLMMDIRKAASEVGRI